MNTEILNLNGEKYIAIPYVDFEKATELLKDAQAITDVTDIESIFASGKMECYPSSVVDAIIMDNKNAIKVFREYRGMTQKELANAIGKSVGMIKKLERGEREGSISTIKAISAALNIDVDLLI